LGTKLPFHFAATGRRAVVLHEVITFSPVTLKITTIAAWSTSAFASRVALPGFTDLVVATVLVLFFLISAAVEPVDVIRGTILFGVALADTLVVVVAHHGTAAIRILTAFSQLCASCLISTFTTVAD